MGKRFVRITFKPAGKQRRVTRWAVKERRPGLYTFCDASGDTSYASTDEKDVRHMLLATPAEVVEQEAHECLKYGTLELGSREACPVCQEMLARSS